MSAQDSTAQSGKGLQQEGEALPAEEASVIALNEGEALPVEESSIDGVVESNTLATGEAPATAQNRVVNSSSLGINNVPLDNAEVSPTSKELVGDGKVATEQSGNKTDSKVAAVSVLAGLDALKRGASNETGKVSESAKIAADFW